MKRGGGVHTVPKAGAAAGWSNTMDGKVLSNHRTKEVAVAAGREIARRLRVEHTIHNTDSEISAKNSYGNDPNTPKDKN